MKKHIQIRDSYGVWHPKIMHMMVRELAASKGYSKVIFKNSHVIEWWLHNVGFYLTLPFIKNPKIKALNNRFRHVDLMVSEVEGNNGT